MLKGVVLAISETVLEMHYHRPIMDAIRDTIGVGPQGSVSFYKYSTQRECFVGFDQAYAVSELSEHEFFNLVKDAAQSKSPCAYLSDQFLGYFLQFKVVKRMERFSRYTPRMITNKPHYRVSLDTTKNASTGLSQHELLFNLSQNAGALVYYACPMIFDKASLYEVDVDLASLRLTDFDDCVDPYLDNDNHFIFFNDQIADPVWCSDPVRGTAISASDFATKLVEKEVSVDRASETSKRLLDTLTNFESAGLSRETKLFRDMFKPSFVSLLADSLTIVRITRSEESA